MKNLILTMCLLMVVSLTYAQLHVVKEQLDNDGNVITQNGAVGIGTNMPTQMLDVNGNVNINKGLLTIKDSGGGRKLSQIHLGEREPGKSVSNYFSLIEGGKYVTSFTHAGDGHFQLRTNDLASEIRFVTSRNTANGPKGTVRMVVRPVTGNVGIGTSDPQFKLQVNGSAAKEGSDSWDVLSDKRAKKNIDTYNLGLNEVLKLNPVTFNYNGKAGIEDTEKEYVGLIAQEFAEIMPSAVSKYSHTDTVSNKTEEFMAINASSVRYMLVNGMKEQQALIEAQKAALETLKTEVAELKANGLSPATPGASEMSVLLEGNGTESALLSQNSPNPFRTNTRIEYFIPQNSKHCRLSFRDMNGKELKQVDIEHEGIGAIDLTSKDLAAGIYSYVLYVNGDIVASKKMILRQ